MTLVSSTDSLTAVSGFTVVAAHVGDVAWRLVIVIFVHGGGRMRSVIRVLAQSLLSLSKKLWLVLGVEEFLE
jgi:hypothetical protein